jgi:N-acetylmuramoyl-L-alanine amidase
MKLFLIAGHHIKDPGAVANGYEEAKLTIELQGLIANNVEKLGIDCKKDDPSWRLSEAISWLSINSNEEDLILDLHFNAASPSATGTECYYPFLATDKEIRIANELAKITSETLSIKNRGAKSELLSQHKRLAIMEPRGTNVLLEVCFITNKSDMESYQKNKVTLANNIARFIKEESLKV